MSFWIIDPKTKEPSVSLTLLMIATVAILACIGLQVAGIAKDIQLVTEFWMGSAALYFGRRYNKGVGFSAPDSGNDNAKENN